jgi:hypothetical protein
MARLAHVCAGATFGDVEVSTKRVLRDTKSVCQYYVIKEPRHIGTAPLVITFFIFFSACFVFNLLLITDSHHQRRVLFTNFSAVHKLNLHIESSFNMTNGIVNGTDTLENQFGTYKMVAPAYCRSLTSLIHSFSWYQWVGYLCSTSHEKLAAGCFITVYRVGFFFSLSHVSSLASNRFL